MSIHRLSSVALLGTLAVTFAASSPLRGETTLRWKFEAGQKNRLTMTQDMQMKMMVQQKPVLMTTTSIMEFDWEVSNVDDQGVATFSQTLDRVQMKMQGPQGVIMQYDSQDENKPQGMAAMMAPAFDAMINKPYITRMDPRGNIVEMKLPEGLAESMSKLPGGGQFGNMFSEEGLKGMTEIATFPEEPVKPGDTWSRTATMKNPATGDTTVVTTYRYVGPETRDGREVEKIALEVELQLGEGKDATVKLLQQDGSGAIYFDNQRGQLVAGESNMKMKMQISAMGQQLEQDMEIATKTDVKPVDASEKKDN